MSTWIPLSSIEDGSAWDRFDRKFQFRPSIYPKYWPGICEPTPSVVLRVGPAWSTEPAQPAGYEAEKVLSKSEWRAVWDAERALENGINTVALTAFQSLLAPEQSLYALDWNHASYRFYPHREFDLDNWPIPVYLDGDYSVFLTRDFDAGTFWHPWEGTLCIFGAALVTLLSSGLADLLGEPLRARQAE